ncbi:MAG: LysM peptidoglycan-binding domain-containing C40 family peptidase [Clostridia bacterium]
MKVTRKLALLLVLILVLLITQLQILFAAEHTVKAGDTLSALANHYETTVTMLKAANDLTSDELSIDQVLQIPSSTKQITKDTTSNASIVAKKELSTGSIIARSAYKYLGSRYVHGGISPKGFDCSGLTSYLYKQAGIKIPRVSRAQYKEGTKIGYASLKPGDLVFFNKGGKSAISHVGMYVGNDTFIHASTPSSGVRKDRLSTWKMRGRYVGAARY